MSARVISINPFSLAEMRRLREAVVARPPSFKPDPEARAKVCRNLYGCASADDSRAFAAKELAMQRERAADRWGFDFLREVPRTQGSGATRYRWTRVRVGAVPAAYKMPRMTLPMAPAATPAALPLNIIETAKTTVPVAVVSSPESTTANSPVEVIQAPAITNINNNTVAAPIFKKQTTISDFMVCRKRSRDGEPKKIQPDQGQKRRKLEEEEAC